MQMDKIREMKKGEIEATVEEPNVVVSFKVAENAYIRASITPYGELYLNGSWGTLFIRPDSANTCFVSILPIGVHLESHAVAEGG
jgi:hypothetical protein